MSTLPNIVFLGSDAICLPALDYLQQGAAELCNLRAVISQPDRRRGRGKHLQPNPVAAWARANGVELIQPEKPDGALADWMRAQAVRVGLVMAYGHFLPRQLRKAPVHGLLNFHGSLLPHYRGASPVETAIACGETETGVSLMKVVKAMDAGGVADYETVSIGSTITAPELRAQVGNAVVPLLQRNLERMLLGELVFVAQDLSQATFTRKLCKEDGVIDFSLPAVEIYNRLRAFTPWPGGYFDHREKRIKVGRARVAMESTVASAEPGQVIHAGSSLRVATGKGLICFESLQLPGARMLPAADFLRGYAITPNERLTGSFVEELVYTKS